MEIDDRKKEIAQYIGKKILDLRKSQKLSREQFAEKTNLSANYIYEVEKGNSIPGCIALIDICNFCKIAPSASGKQKLLQGLSRSLVYSYIKVLAFFQSRRAKNPRGSAGGGFQAKINAYELYLSNTA